jgi:uridine kinase
MLTFILPDGREVQYPAGTVFQQIASDQQSQYASPIVAVKFNNEIHDLTAVSEKGGVLSFIDLSLADGVRIYARSLSLVLVRAIAELFPGCKVRFEHSLSKGLYGEVDIDGNKPFTEKEVNQLKERMGAIITADELICRDTVPVAEAIEYFQKTGQLDKVRLLRYKKEPMVHIYRLGSFLDYFYGYMVPSTGYLRQFDLRFYLPGFVLQYPTIDDPNRIPVFKEQQKLARIFDEYEHWAEILEVRDVGSLNDQIAAGKGRELIRIAEALQEKKLAQIADRISAERERIKLVSIAGPSSSGKTTFAQRLAVQLRVNGLRPISVSIDNYFVDREHTPLGVDGKPDYEGIESIDLNLLNEHLIALIQGRPVTMPIYDFQSGMRQWHPEPLRIAKDQPLLIEGIHGLNDKLTAAIPKNQKYKIYVSALTQLNIDDHNRIPTTDNRLIRRIVRDNQFRSHNALKTLSLWPAVRRGEETYIFPFQEEADVMFNSALIYELAILKKYAEPLLALISNEHPEFSEAKRLLRFLSYFLPISEEEEVPPNSILREFIGGSCFC